MKEQAAGDPRRRATLWRAHLARYPVPQTSIDVLLDHFDHAIAVAGPAHVGLGADWDGVASMPEGLEDVSGYPLLLAVLFRRGYSRDEVAKVAGLNLLRVMTEVERVADELQRTEAPIDVRITDLDGSEHLEAPDD